MDMKLMTSSTIGSTCPYDSKSRILVLLGIIKSKSNPDISRYNSALPAWDIAILKSYPAELEIL
jgi:hypothetical protein